MTNTIPELRKLADIPTWQARAHAREPDASKWHFRMTKSLRDAEIADLRAYTERLEVEKAEMLKTAAMYQDLWSKAKEELAATQQVQGEPVVVYQVKSTIHPNGWHDCSKYDFDGHIKAGFATRTLYAAQPPAPAAEEGRAVLSPLDYRAQGRMEAMQIILSEDAESPFDSCATSSANGDAGDYSTYWNEAKLRELLHIDDTAYNAFDKAEYSYWDSTAKIEQAERAMRVIERAPYFKPLHDFLAKHQEWNLLHDLQAAATEAEKAVLSRCDAGATNPVALSDERLLGIAREARDGDPWAGGQGVYLIRFGRAAIAAAQEGSKNG